MRCRSLPSPARTLSRPTVAMARLVPAMILLASASAAAQPQVASPADTTGRIVASASAQSQLPADEVLIRIAVETRDPSAAGAGAANARIQQRVLEALRAAGVPPSRISTAGYAVVPQQTRGSEERPPETAGYLARNAIQVRLTDLDRVGAIVDTALAAGANRIDGVHFSASSTDSAQRAALARAIEQARSDAEAMARAAGGRLGRLLVLSTEPLGTRVRAGRFAAAGGYLGQTEIIAREITVAAEVFTEWEFHPVP